MPWTISADEARNRPGTWLGYVSDNDDEAIVESEGKPKALPLSIEAFEEVRELREKQRRAAALAQLRALRDEVRARNQDLTQEEAEELANRMSRDMIDHMAATG